MSSKKLLSRPQSEDRIEELDKVATNLNDDPKNFPQIKRVDTMPL
jgi:hypothetical protein